jgi:hypothetical protein
LRLNKGNVIDQVQLCCYVCLLQISTLSVHLTFVSYTLKENFTSSRFLKNENYTYLKHRPGGPVLHK